MKIINIFKMQPLKGVQTILSMKTMKYKSGKFDKK